MAAYRIVAVRTEPGPGGPHDHISAVKLSGGTVSRATVIADLRNPYGDRYYSEVNSRRTNVIVTACPHCSHGDYITTEPDSAVENNLLSLPRF